MQQIGPIGVSYASQGGLEMRGTSLIVALGLGMALCCGAAQGQMVTLTYTQPLAPQAVKVVQQELQRFGNYRGAVDGQWGPDSVIALQRFQEQHGIQPNAQLNQATAAALGVDPAMLVGPPPAIAYGAQSPIPPAISARSVTAVQGRLEDLGYYHGALDGAWGPATQQALAAFQQQNGLVPNAQLNPATVTALGLSPDWVYAQR
jgi:peptidoglycan hydrolase-like protein with peptidoglycan-binding domain